MKRWITAASFCCVLSGCATVNNTAVNRYSQTVDTSAKSVVLVAVEVYRTDNSRFVPEPFVIKTQTPHAQSKAERQNFKFGRETGSYDKNGHPVYLVSMSLPPGQYLLGDVMGNASAFPVNSIFDVPLLIDFTVKPHSIVYVGHITAKLRHRNGDEFRAGPLLPLIDQAVSGLSTGTWDVAIEDDANQDIASFKDNFPVLASATVEDQELPPFDRAKAQRWWDGQQVEDQKVAANAKPTPVSDANPVATIPAATTPQPAPVSVADAAPAPASVAPSVATTMQPATSVATVATTAAPSAEAVATPPIPVAAASLPAALPTSANTSAAQDVATQMGCGAVQTNGDSTFVASCGSYSVLIDCDGGQCRPMHTVGAKNND
jgi:hypothetical protein